MKKLYTTQTVVDDSRVTKSCRRIGKAAKGAYRRAAVDRMTESDRAILMFWWARVSAVGATAQQSSTGGYEGFVEVKDSCQGDQGPHKLPRYLMAVRNLEAIATPLRLIRTRPCDFLDAVTSLAALPPGRDLVQECGKVADPIAGDTGEVKPMKWAKIGRLLTIGKQWLQVTVRRSRLDEVGAEEEQRGAGDTLQAPRWSIRPGPLTAELCHPASASRLERSLPLP